MAQDAAHALNPGVTVHAHPERIDAGNARQLLADADVIIDGCDNFSTRLIVADAALELRIPLVSAAVDQFEDSWPSIAAGKRTSPATAASSAMIRRDRR